MLAHKGLRKRRGCPALELRRLGAQGAGGHREEVGVDREAGVGHGDEDGRGVSHVDGPASVLLRIAMASAVTAFCRARQRWVLQTITATA